MNVAILSSSSNNIDSYYGSIARSISHYLACNDFDLVYGGCSTSMMGICYDEFSKNNRKIYSFTTEKYTDDIANLPKAMHYIRKTTFDMKKDMFENSDLIVALPGGMGTLSELLAFMEENRSNDKQVPIMIYDENNDYQFLFQQLLYLEQKGFHQHIMDFMIVCHNKEEFEQNLIQIMSKEEGKRK